MKRKFHLALRTFLIHCPYLCVRRGKNGSTFICRIKVVLWRSRCTRPTLCLSDIRDGTKLCLSFRTHGSSILSLGIVQFSSSLAWSGSILSYLGQLGYILLEKRLFVFINMSDSQWDSLLQNWIKPCFSNIYFLKATLLNHFSYITVKTNVLKVI